MNEVGILNFMLREATCVVVRVMSHRLAARGERTPAQTPQLTQRPRISFWSGNHTALTARTRPGAATGAVDHVFAAVRTLPPASSV
jgi:hypothetical protein